MVEVDEARASVPGQQLGLRTQGPSSSLGERNWGPVAGSLGLTVLEAGCGAGGKRSTSVPEKEP